MDSQVEQIVAVDENVSFSLPFLPSFPQIVFLLTTVGTVLRSTDGGIHWTDLSAQLLHFKDRPSTVLARSRSGAWWLYQAEANRQVVLCIASPPLFSLLLTHKVYILGNSGRLWWTKDGGETYEYQATGLEIGHLITHPTEAGWALIHHFAPCCFTGTCEFGCVFDVIQ